MPSYKIRYFDFTGRAEPIRMLLAYGNIPYEDERISNDDWPKVKSTTPFGQVPVLEIDGKPVPHSIPIYRYLANLVGLAGNNLEENLTIDVAVETLFDLRNMVVYATIEKDEATKQEKLQKAKEAMPLYLEKLEKHAKKNDGYIACPRFSWADIVFLTAYETLMGTFGTNVFNSYPSLKQVKNNALSQPAIKEWIMKRPELKCPTEYDVKQEL